MSYGIPIVKKKTWTRSFFFSSLLNFSPPNANTDDSNTLSPSHTSTSVIPSHCSTSLAIRSCATALYLNRFTLLSNIHKQFTATTSHSNPNRPAALTMLLLLMLLHIKNGHTNGKRNLFFFENFQRIFQN